MIRGDSWGLKSPWAPWAAAPWVGSGRGHRLVLGSAWASAAVSGWAAFFHRSSP